MKLLYYFLCVIIFSGCMLWEQTKPEPVVIQAPTTVSTTIAPADSSYLSITIDVSSDTSDTHAIIDNGNDYAISLRGKSLTDANINSVDSFLMQHKAYINADKVIVSNKPGTPYSPFKKLNDVLKKFGILKFKLISQ